jgi:hypothetical protein
MYIGGKRRQQAASLALGSCVSAEQADQLLDKDHFHDAEIMGQLPGKMVVIQAPTPLVSTLECWRVHWAIMLRGPFSGLILLMLVLRANRG